MVRASLLEKILLLIADFLALSICFYFAFWLQFHSGWIVEKLDPSRSFTEYLKPAFVVNALWVLLFAFAGLYRKWLLESRLFHVMIILRGVTYGLVLILVAVFGLEVLNHIFSPTPQEQVSVYASRFKLILLYVSMVFVSVASLRLFVLLFLRQLLRQGFGADRLLVLGANPIGLAIQEKLAKCPQLGHRVVGFMDERHAVMESRQFAGLPVMGKYADLPKVVRREHIGGIVIAHESSSIREVLRIFDWVADLPIHIYVVPDLYDVVAGHFKGNLVHGIELQEVFAFNMAPWQVRVKRLLDLVVAGLLLLFSFPVLLLTTIIIKLDSKGPVFYSQERVGLYGRPFMVHKFRTMRTDAEKGGPQWATKNDPRITRIGRFLRKTRIDEIPQLLCVLRGDMSMVGPRPERQHFVEKLRQQIPFYMFRLKMKPGLTGWAQVRHSYDSSIEDVQQKLKYDLYYFENMSILMDVQILFRTVWVVISGKGAQ